jgi:hypothetical protein
MAFQSFQVSAKDTAPVAGDGYLVIAQLREYEDMAFGAVSATPQVRTEIRPASVVVPRGGTARFQAVALESDGVALPTWVAWSATGGSMNALTGTWTAPTALGQYRIYATTGMLSDTATDSIGRPPPAAPGEPTLQATDVVVYREDFESLASTEQLKAAYPERRESRGTIQLDQVVAFEGQKSFRIDWDYHGCLRGADADVLIERGIRVGEGQRDWYVSYYARWTEGYLFAWPSGSRCSGNSSKEMPIFRGAGLPRITWAATREPACPEIYGRINSLRWTFAIGAEPGSTQPSCGSNYRQYLALGSKDPASLGDGQWHRITFRYLKESAIDAGDGIVQVWIDGVQIMDYDGTDIDNPAYGRVYTRTTPMFRPLQYQSVIVRGAPQVQSRWYDDVKIWYRP